MLHAFFDETGTHAEANVTAVAGFIFEKSKLEDFGAAWSQEILGLEKPYHTGPCFHGYRPFHTPEWPRSRREALMDSLARLTARNTLAGFIAQTSRDEFEEALENGPGIKKLIVSPYTLCLLAIVSMATEWAQENGLGNNIQFWFEAGAPHEKETREFIRRLSNKSESPVGARIHAAEWANKDEAIALNCADLLAWEWQRNVNKSPDYWTDRMKILGEGGRLQAQHINATVATLWSMHNLFHKLHRD